METQEEETEMDSFNRDESYDVVSVDQHPYLFTNARIDRSTVPEGLFVYDVADADCDGTFSRIQPHVLVNHWGTIIGPHELTLENGAYYPKFGSEEYEGCYFDPMTLDELLKANPDDYRTNDVKDGEFAMSPGNKYEFTGTLNGKVKKEDIMESMVDNWPYGEVSVSEMNVEQNENGDTKITITVISTSHVRNQSLADAMLAVADELGTFFDYEEPYVKPLKAAS